VALLATVNLALNQTTPGVPNKVAHLQELMDQTGIQVTYDYLQEESLRQKVLLDFSQGTGIYDVVMTGTDFAPAFSTRQYIEPLDSYINDPSLTDDKDLAFSDFVKINIDMMTFNGQLYGLPHYGHAQVGVYRKDILDQLKMDVPKTFDDWERLARTVEEMNLKNDAGQKVHGFALNGQAGQGQNVGRWTSVAIGFGGGILNSSMQPMLTDPGTIKGTDWWARMIQKYSTPGSAANAVTDTIEAMKAGTCALNLDFGPILTLLGGPDSKTKGLWLLADTPTDGRPLQGVPNNYAWVFSLSSQSKNKPAAWKVLSFLVSRSLNDKLYNEGYRFEGAVTRQSELELPGVKGQPWTEVTLRASANANPDDKPRIPEWPQIGDLIGAHVAAASSGQESPSDAMAKATAEIDPILRQAGYYS